MPKISGGLNLGGGNVSALLRSTSSIQSQMTTYEDTIQKVNYENSAKTDSDFAIYKAYLDSRVQALNSTGRLTDATKAVDMNQSILNAAHQNMSSNIQRVNIQIMAGNATLDDKLQMVMGQYQTAASIGDMSLAQSLMSQAYSIQQQSQYEKQTAALAQQTLYNDQVTAANKVVTDYKDTESTILGRLAELNDAYKKAGADGQQKAIQDWVNNNKELLNSLHVDITKTPNYYDIVNGVQHAIINTRQLESAIIQPYDTYEAKKYQMSADAMMNGLDKVPTISGDMTILQTAQASADPTMTVYNASTGGRDIASQAGYQYDQYGYLQKAYSANTNQPDLSQQQKDQLKKLGFDITSSNVKNGESLHISGKAPSWLTNEVGTGSMVNVYFQSDGSIQLGGIVGGKNNYYTIHTQNGKSGIFQNTSAGPISYIGGDNGFNSQSFLMSEAQLFQTAQQQKTLQQAQQVASKSTSGQYTVQQPIQIQQATDYLHQQGIKTYPITSLSAQNQLTQAAIELQPYYQTHGTINGRAYNYAGEFIPSYQQRAGGGYNFVDASGNPISALTYSQQAHVSFGNLLGFMGQHGDTYAGSVAPFASDSGVKAGAPGNTSSLTWSK